MQDKAIDVLRAIVRSYENMDPAPMYVHRARKVLVELELSKRGDVAVTDLVKTAASKWGRVKVDVGCGPYPRGEDFITVDRYAGEVTMTQGKMPQADGTVIDAMVETTVKADIKADMWDLPFDDASVDEIWCSHALEHAPMSMVPATLAEFQRILRVGGRCIVTVPNFDYVAKYWLLGQQRDWAEKLVMGTQETDGEHHRCCFNAELLRGDLEGNGFSVKVLKIVWTHGQECLQAVAIKMAKK